MIFVTVGSMFPFDRLTKATDSWAARAEVRDMLIQIGSGEYVPSHARWTRMMARREFNEAVSSCDLVVAHLGMGSIITALQAQKPILLLPRIFELGEHTSNHQLHGVDWLRNRPGIWIADDADSLHRYLDEFQAGRLTRPTDRPDEHASPELIAHVRDFIAGRT